MISGEHTGQPAAAGGRLNRPRDHGLMADVHAVENPQGQMQRLPERGEFIKAIANQHSAAIPRRGRIIKPRPAKNHAPSRVRAILVGDQSTGSPG